MWLVDPASRLILSGGLQDENRFSVACRSDVEANNYMCGPHYLHYWPLKKAICLASNCFPQAGLALLDIAAVYSKDAGRHFFPGLGRFDGVQLALHATPLTPHVSLRGCCKRCLPGR